jgi:hypothetical protein
LPLHFTLHQWSVVCCFLMVDPNSVIPLDTNHLPNPHRQ